MAPATSEDNLAFVLTCLQSAIDGGSKISFDNVAKTHNIGGRAAYMRLWQLRKKAGLIASDAIVQHSGDDDNTTKPTKKRGRPAGSGKGRESKKQKSRAEDIKNGGGEADDAEDGGTNGSAGTSNVQEDHDD